MLYQFKRTAIHNICVTSSCPFPQSSVAEGLVLPKELMRLGDIAPFERVLVTKHGGDNWINRIYSFAIPGDNETVEARGSLAYLLKAGEYCCIISGTYLNSEQYKRYCGGKLHIPMIDIRFHPEEEPPYNKLSKMKVIQDFLESEICDKNIDDKVISKRRQLPRIMLSNLASGLVVNEIERHCLEMSAELPVNIMKKAGLIKNQTIFVFNASRGGISAESYVVPNNRDSNIVISGALSRIADLGDIISEASYVITNETQEPTIFNAKNE